MTPVHSPRLRRLWLAAGLLFILAAAPAPAHDPFSGIAEATIHDDGSLDFHMDFNSTHIQNYMAGYYEADNQVSEYNLPNIQDYLAEQARDFYHISSDGRRLECGEITIKIDDMLEYVMFDYHCPGPLGDSVVFDAVYLEELNPEFNSTLLVLDERKKQLALGVLDPGATVLEVLLPWLDRPASATLHDAGSWPTAQLPPAGPGAAPRKSVSANTTPGQMFMTFLKLGIEHILRGYDHLLFLLGLLIVCRDFRSTALIVTCFTLAHSITLAASTLDFIVFPARLTDILVAATIVYVGVENLVFKGEPQRRWILTFCFGMLHGFGFATALRNMGLGREGSSILMPLFSFNLGVEAGQLIVAALILPILWQLRKQEKFKRHGIPALSVFVALCGGFWLVQRVFFG